MTDATPPSAGAAPLLEVKDLAVHFPVGRRGLFGRGGGVLKAVDGVSFTVYRGETLGLVGESGSGKTTVGRAVLRALEPAAGSVTLYRDDEAIDVTGLDPQDLKRVWRHMQMIFQDPYSSLNPSMTVADIIGEPLRVNGVASGSELKEQVMTIAGRCGFNVAHLNRYPHAFSGGQRQRVAIARALVLHPAFVVCDEPVSALDVSIQAQVLNLLKELQGQFGLTYLFIAHDLATVAYACDRVAVMYLGQLVEVAPTEKLYYTPLHPYTEALMSAIPVGDPDLPIRPVQLKGERPNPSDPPAGCRFHTRCRFAQDVCVAKAPPLAEFATGHYVSCHFAGDLDLKGAMDHPASTVARR
jgi:oligopeptide/dipeptide ABC transporter ATP-binding protein